MSNTEIIERDGKNGRFVSGNSGGPGRSVGSRNRLGEQYLQDLKTVWAEEGIDALRRCAQEDATGFCRLVGNLMPRDLNINHDITVDVADFAERFRGALALLGNEPKVKTIEQPARKPR
jgi:hypothetical protein